MTIERSAVATCFSTGVMLAVCEKKREANSLIDLYFQSIMPSDYHRLRPLRQIGTGIGDSGVYRWSAQTWDRTPLVQRWSTTASGRPLSKSSDHPSSAVD